MEHFEENEWMEYHREQMATNTRYRIRYTAIRADMEENAICNKHGINRKPGTNKQYYNKQYHNRRLEMRAQYTD